jgi:ribosomal protein S18 acetylase RimI-like enzyme
MDIEIRCMTIEDYDSVYALWSSTPGMGLHGFEDSREGIDKFLRRNPGCSFVAVKDDSIIGAVLGGHDGRKGYIYHATLAPAMRGLGYGRRLVEAVKHALAREGIKRLGLLVFTENDTGNAFWSNSGWTRRGDVNYYSLSIIRGPQKDVRLFGV